MTLSGAHNQKMSANRLSLTAEHERLCPSLSVLQVSHLYICIKCKYDTSYVNILVARAISAYKT